MDKFSIEVRAGRNVGTDDAQAIAIRRGSKLTFTRLLRPGEEQFDDFLLAPPSQLAFG